jgi:hypothetical protein
MKVHVPIELYGCMRRDYNPGWPRGLYWFETKVPVELGQDLDHAIAEYARTFDLIVVDRRPIQDTDQRYND